jgi:hypothetical protein
MNVKMLRRVVSYKLTDISEVLTAPIIRAMALIAISLNQCRIYYWSSHTDSLLMFNKSYFVITLSISINGPISKFLSSQPQKYN